MKVLLVAINTQFVHASPVPWYLKAACRGLREIAFSVKEFTINDRHAHIVAEILLQRPDVLAISCYIWNYEMVLKIVPDIKKILPDIKVLLGGPEAEFSPQPWFCDAVLTGDGEVSLPNYFGMQPSVADPFLEDFELHRIAAKAICEAGAGKIVYLETVRGCPYQCSYCLAPQTGRVRKLPMSLVKELIDVFMNADVRQVKFVDRTFNADRTRAVEILRYIFETDAHRKEAGKQSPQSWHFEVAGDLFDEELFALIALLPPGLVQFEIGVQSLNAEVLQDAVRVTDTESVLANISRLVNTKRCLVHADLIAGLPGEDMESFQRGFDQLHATKPHQLQLGFLKVLKGTTLAKRAAALGLVWSDNAPFQVLQTAQMSWDALQQLTRIEEMVERCWNNGRFTDTIELLAKGQFFAFYRELDEAIGDARALPMSASSMAIALDTYAQKHCNAEESEAVRRTVLIDLLTSCFPVKIPKELRYELPLKKMFAAISRQAEVVFGKTRTHFEPISAHEVLVLDCEQKDPVTGRFRYFVLPTKSFQQTEFPSNVVQANQSL